MQYKSKQWSPLTLAMTCELVLRMIGTMIQWKIEWGYNTRKTNLLDGLDVICETIFAIILWCKNVLTIFLFRPCNCNLFLYSIFGSADSKTLKYICIIIEKIVVQNYSVYLGNDKNINKKNCLTTSLYLFVRLFTDSSEWRKPRNDVSLREEERVSRKKRENQQAPEINLTTMSETRIERQYIFRITLSRKKKINLQLTHRS